MGSDKVDEKLVHRDMERTCGVASGTVHVQVGSEPAVHVRAFKCTEPIIVINHSKLPWNALERMQSIQRYFWILLHASCFISYHDQGKNISLRDSLGTPPVEFES